MRKLMTALVAIVLFVVGTPAVLAGYPDPGTGRSNIYIQNTGDTDATMDLVFTTGETGQTIDPPYSAGTVPPKGMKIVQSASYPVSDGWAGSIEVQSSQPASAIVALVWDNDTTGAKTSGAYKGIDAPATEAYLPWLAVRDVHNSSLITVQNTADAAADVRIHLLDRNGTERKVIADSLPAKTEKTFDLTLAQYRPDFEQGTSYGQGSAYITSTQPIATVGSMYWGPVTNYSADAYSGVSTGESVLWFPSMFRMYNPACGNKYDSRCFPKYVIPTVQNLGDVPTVAELQYIKYDGSVTHVLTETIGPKAAQGFNTASIATLDPDKYQAMADALDAEADSQGQWRGSIKVTSQAAPGQSQAQPLAGVAVYYARNTGVLDCVMFNAVRDSETSPGQPVSLPFVSRQLNAGVADRFSTSLLQNITSNSGDLTIEFYNGLTGEKVNHVWTVPVGPNSLVAINLKNAVDVPESEMHQYLGDYFTGSIFVTPSSTLRMVAVTDVFWDGVGRAIGYSAFPVSS